MNDIELTFKGIDYWNRPVYKAKDMNVYIGSVDTLFPDKAIAPNNSISEINEYFRNHLDELVIFGNTFDEDDPLGTSIKKSINIKIIDNDTDTNSSN
jgi:hypothetical protein